MLRLKMVVNTVAQHGGQEGLQAEEITCSAVYSSKEGSANNQWSKATPQGQLKFTVTNPGAFGKVKPGMWLMIDLHETDKDS